MNILLSILIPSTFDRSKVLGILLMALNEQIKNCNAIDTVEILTEIDNRELPTGTKRNRLINKANGEYVVHVDDDDELSPCYLPEILLALEKRPDVVGFEGWMETNSTNRKHFKISMHLPYLSVRDNEGKEQYHRFNNHLSPVRRDIALQIGFKDAYIGEDYDYAVRLKDSGLLKTEVYIPKELYYYKFNPHK